MLNLYFISLAAFYLKLNFNLFGSFLHNCMSGGGRTQILPLLVYALRNYIKSS